MDDLSITDRRLAEGLHGLRKINRYLGGYAAVWSAIERYLSLRRRPVHLLDVGAGSCDIPAVLIRRADRMGRRIRITALDVNPASLEYAAGWLEKVLSPDQFDRLELVEGDLLSSGFNPGHFDLCTASLFLHHLNDREAVRALRRMDDLARDGLIINDLHRTPAAYLGLKLINSLLPVPEMVRHDGPISILRGFRKRELQRLAVSAGLTDYSITWHWAFRWTLSTVTP